MGCHLVSQPARSSQIVWVGARIARAQLGRTEVTAVVQTSVHLVFVVQLVVERTSTLLMCI